MIKTTQAVCVHGHFYQPPREDPLTNQIPHEAGASPYPNWNERIHDQCYRTNAQSGNFENISFNIGPTLVQWMKRYDRKTLDLIVEQDWINMRRYGVGNAMAQAYNHTILPLSSTIDKMTQIIWGIADFKFLFSHTPSGMWLPETAVDIETLDILAQNGIKFTVLAPWQADTKELDVSQPYWVETKEGRRIVVFFYHQELSASVSFDPIATANADTFAKNILAPNFTDHKDRDQILIVASDGEAYGHHHRFNDKFLHFLLTDSIKKVSIQKTFPALWLQSHMPEKMIKIHENTSWSCHHGVKRWSDTCGCSSNGIWKKPLREAFNQIAQDIDFVFEQYMSNYTDRVWDILFKYIDVIHGKYTLEKLIQTHCARIIQARDIRKIDLLLRAQYERQKIFTSCGWFFDEFDRIEPINNIKYAAQAVWYIQLATEEDYSSKAIQHLKQVMSDRSGLTADMVFRQHMQRLEEDKAQAQVSSAPVPKR